MAADNRPFKSKEQDGQGNEVIIRDQQLVEQGTATTMASGACFETRDVDDRPVKIPRDNMMNIVLECIGIILNDSSRNLGTNVQKALGLQGNTVGHSTVADFASVLGVNKPLIKYQSSSFGANIMLYALLQLSDYNRNYPVRGIALVYLESGAWQLFSFDYLHDSYFTTAKIQGDTDISTNEGGTIGYGQYLWVIPFNLF